MKKLYFILVLILLFSNVKATNYYISTSDSLANDMNNGTSVLTPWASFTPLNTLLLINSSIGTVYLKCGDIFRGQINLTVGNNIIFTSYGSGNKPIISGANIITSWTTVGSYYQANESLPITNFFVADKEQILARFPDDGSYLTVDAASNTYLQDSALNSLSSSVLNASQVCIHTAQWCWEKSRVASSLGNQINYVTNTLQIPTVNYGYFLYDEISYLTAGKEWKYDITAQKIYYKPTSGDPNTMTCEASVRAYGILLSSGVSNIQIINIQFEKQSESGVAMTNTTNDNVKIDNCYFARQYKYGIDVQGINTEISNSYFTEIDGIGIYIKGSAANIHHNIFKDNGGFRNSGIGQEINLSTIKCAFANNNHIHHNDIDGAGYCGISVDGAGNLVERNIIKNTMRINNDGAALKSFGVASINNILKNNFITTSEGNTEGNPPMANFDTPAIYFDFNVNHCTVQENTVYGRTKKGIFLNSGTNNNTITGNVIYGGDYLIHFNGSPAMPTPMTGYNVQQNVFFARKPTDYVVLMLDNTGGYNHGTINNNYYFQPFNSNNYGLIVPSTALNFATWKSTTGYDTNSVSSFVNWTYPTDNSELFMNQTDNVVTTSLGTTKYLDLNNVEVCGSITLQPYTSKILINANTTCALGINEFSDDNEIIIYPNPCSTSVHILINDKTNNLKLAVFNQLGQTVFKGFFINGEAEIEVAHLMSGIYFIQTDENKRQVKKFVKL